MAAKQRAFAICVWASAVAVGCALAATSLAQCPPKYSVDLTPPVWCGFFYAGIAVTGISDIGELCGGGGTCGKTQSAHFVWDCASPPIYLPMPPTLPGGVPADINSARQVVGYMDNTDVSGTRYAYRHHNGVTVDLGWLPGHNNAEAMAINESGVICGNSRNSAVGPLIAVIWTNKGITSINLPMGPNSEALDIADDGTVCGWMGDAPYWITCHVFVWKDGFTTDLGTVLPGADTAVASALNNVGSVCGYSIYQPLSQNPIRKAFIWHKGQVQNLGTLPLFPSSFAIDVNDAATVVGNCIDASGNGTRAFVWQNGVMHALQDLVPPEYNLQIINATAINNAGQIAAYGHYQNPKGVGNIYVAMRLNPIPPLTGDLNCDWQVNVPDLLAVISAWGPCPPQPPGEPFTETCHADINNDGVVNHHDIVAVVLNWTSY